VVTRKSTPNDEGASAVEYGLLLAAVAAVIVLAVFALGGAVTGLFQGTCDAVKAKAAPSSTC
jgi:pilus assembly protein Flp/PilA